MATDKELDNLISMYSRGLLTDEEFVAAKERLRPPTPASTPIAGVFAAAATDQHGQQTDQDRDAEELDKYAAWYESGSLTAEEFEAAARALQPDVDASGQVEPEGNSGTKSPPAVDDNPQEKSSKGGAFGVVVAVGAFVVLGLWLVASADSADTFDYSAEETTDTFDYSAEETTYLFDLNWQAASPDIQEAMCLASHSDAGSLITGWLEEMNIAYSPDANNAVAHYLVMECGLRPKK